MKHYTTSDTKMRFIVIFSIISAAFAAPNKTKDVPIVPMLDGRIIGGSAVNIDNFPYQLSLQYFGSHICGASIISAEWAVTAAHCVSGSSATWFTVRAGSSDRSSGGFSLSVSTIIVHADYNSRNVDFDVSVLRVSSAFNIGATGINTVDLPLAGTTPSEGVDSVVSGWGTLASGSSILPTQLQAVEVPIVSRANCRSAYGQTAVTDRMMCAGFPQGGRDACQGDSGGPLVVANALVGIVSWGYGCAVAGFPGVYTDVGSVRDWIQTNTGV